MVDSRIYQIVVANGISEEAVNATSPLQVSVSRVTPGQSVLAVRADQASLVGLIRHLHQQGYLLLSVTHAGEREDLDA